MQQVLSFLLIYGASLLLANPLMAQDPGAGGVRADTVRADTVRPVEPRPVPGAGWIEVPRVTGLPVALAEGRVRMTGLRSEVVEMASDRPAGRVARQSPQWGALARRGDTVTLFVAVPQSARVPSLIGATRARAVELLAQAGLALGGVVRQASREPVGEVIAQRPKAGAAVPAGSPVAITVSDPQLVTVPAIVGRSRAEAESALREAGLAPGTPREAQSSQTAGSVLAQDPAAGAVVERGTAVQFTIAIAPPVVTAPAGAPPRPVAPAVSNAAPATPAPATPAPAVVPETPTSTGPDPTAPQVSAPQTPPSETSSVQAPPRRPNRLPWLLAGGAVLLALAALGVLQNARERRKRRSAPRIEVRTKPGASIRAVIRMAAPEHRDE